jgi:hypothetical protein
MGRPLLPLVLAPLQSRIRRVRRRRKRTAKTATWSLPHRLSPRGFSACELIWNYVAEC